MVVVGRWRVGNGARDAPRGNGEARGTSCYGSSASRRSKRIRTPSSAISGWPGPYRNDAVFWHKQENSPDEALKHAAEYADKALQLAPDDANAHYAGARIHTEAGEVEQAIARYDQAIALNPSALECPRRQCIPAARCRPNRRSYRSDQAGDGHRSFPP
ncbi:tetratricopeptide repeat protein [Mesorhizobium sp.]|uniref:tetratricopeptide repeat protein n=1 Tax=Mesorhizobium sp. TaxID=1871066 RepID=UPI0033905976